MRIRRLLRFSSPAALAGSLLLIGSAAAFPGANGRVVFDRGGTLWTVSSAGSGATAFVAGTQPAVSPDGLRVAYVAGGTIRTIALDGSGAVDTGAAGTTPSWSPDGSKLVFRNGTGEIRTMNANGSALSAAIATGNNPVISPNGATIAFDDGADVFTVPVGGGTATDRSQSGGTNTNPTWSPDGARIAFVSTRDGGAELYAMNADGSGQQRLTTNAITEAAPSWSPDGSRIAVALSGGNDGIWTVDVATGSRQELTATAGDTSPDWGVGFSIGVGAIQEGVADGTIVDGETLTLPAGAITVSGPGTVDGSPEYQWLRCSTAGDNCVAIAGATGSSYTVDGNVGSTIRVRVTLGSTAGPASATSPAVGPVAGAAPANTSLPTITGADTAVQGVALTATTGTWSGSTPIAYTYAWLRCDEAGLNCGSTPIGTTSSYIPTGADIGKKLRVAVTASNGYGSPATATSNATELVASNTPTNTVLPVISTTATTITVGTSLTATAGTWIGAPTITRTFQWQRCNPDGGGCANILGSTSLFYTVLAADIGKRLRIEVTATNAAGTAKAVSALTPTIEGSPPVNVTRPSVTGTASSGQSLFASVGTWTGTTPLTYTYEWRRCNASGASCATIAGATSTSYIVATVDVGSTIAVAVTARNVSGSATVQSSTTAAVTAGTGAGGGTATRATNTKAPAISGVLARGKVLRAANGTWSGTTPMTFSYQWQRCPARTTACTNIARATRSTYTLVAADVGRRIRLTVSAGNAAGITSATSAISKLVAAKAPAAIRRINGNGRANRLTGTARAERIDGKGGNDRIDGRGGKDVLIGGAGNDTILAADGIAETVNCGPGRDRVTADRSDRLIGCEIVTRRPARRR